MGSTGSGWNKPFFFYREKKRQLEQSAVFDAKFTPKNTRAQDSRSEAAPRLSTIEETGQSCDGAAVNRQSAHSKNSQDIRNSQSLMNQTEPQYENLAVAKDQGETYYIEPNAKEELQVKTDAERNTDSFYENFSDPKYGNMVGGDGLYQNTQSGVGDGESFYEDPLQSQNLDIYVDMAWNRYGLEKGEYSFGDQNNGSDDTASKSLRTQSGALFCVNRWYVPAIAQFHPK